MIRGKSGGGVGIEEGFLRSTTRRAQIRRGEKSRVVPVGMTGLVRASTAGGGQGDVVDFGVGAPLGAAGDGDFELAGEIVKVRIAGEFFIERKDDGGDIRDFVGIDASEGASSDVARDITAGASGGQANGVQTFENIGNGFDRNPMELNVLTDGNVGEAVAIFGGKISDGANLIAVEEAIGNANANHEERSGAAFAAGAAEDAQAITLGVNAPGTKIGGEPFSGNGGVTLAGEGANFVKMVPGIFFELEALDALGFAFFEFGHLVRDPFCKPTGKSESRKSKFENR